MKDGPPPDQPLHDQPPYGQPDPYATPYGTAPSYGHPQAAYGPPAPGPRQPSSDDNTMVLLVYLGTLLFGFLVPLIMYFVKRNESALVRFHAAQALNYQITVMVEMLAPFVLLLPFAVLLDAPALIFLGFVPLLALAVSQYVLLIMGAVKGGRGEFWRFPTALCWRMIR